MWGAEAGASLVRKEDWDELSDWGQVVQNLMVGGDAPNFVWMGALESYTLLSGHLVRRYNNRGNPNYNPAGAVVTGMLRPLYVEAFASDVLGARLMGAEGMREVRAHVAGCPECRGVLAALSAMETPAPDAGQIVTGMRVGRYVVLGLLGEGGMGRVHAAYDPELDRKVALKLLNPGRLSEDSLTEARQRLEREARTMARLSHPRVAQLHDVGEHQGQLFLVMELVEGGTLRRWLLEKPRTRREKVARFVQAAEGLAAMHALGIVHRDFKPDNVLLTRDGQVRITDFGLANATVAQGSRSGPLLPGSGDLTRTGTVLGTPAYAAPEQLRGERGDARSDQFAFCVALYEALHGQRPFEGATREELLASMERQAVRPEQPGVPGWLKALVRRGLSADPTRRFESMDALRARLTRDAGAWTRSAVAAGVAGG
ncbi:serine/threonine-protein kinase, partial [Myxococcus xanthus]|uniref:serine/threonine-protein kinase n=1 Tax=Myxococcus xanthus TaxID=34 RepID=UPI0020A4EB64